MNLKAIIRQTSIYSIGIIFALTACSGTVSAKHRMKARPIHTYSRTIRYRFSRHKMRYHLNRWYVYSRHGYKYYIRRYRRANRKLHSLELKSLSNQGSSFTNGIRYYLLKDINNSRHQNHRKAVKVDTYMQKAANYRRPYVQYAFNHMSYANKYPGKSTEKWVHGFDTHKSIQDYINHHRSKPAYWGENASDYIKGFEELSDYSNPKYENESPKGIAANIDDDFMNHDLADGNHNGHRYNELSPYYKYVGVSVRYDPKINKGSITEDYSS